MIPSNHPIPRDAGVARLVGQLDANRYECFAERAGILEFEAHMPRVEAERQALIQTLARYGFPHAPSVWLLQVGIGDGTQWVLTTDEVATRHQLANQGLTDVSTVDLADVLHRQFGHGAWLSTSP
ncbi:MAG: hypothetical protein JSS57_05440 [Proteobacteria bacterium]|nr:hypothetical protein [Pseudomonadota bacterium]